MSSPSALDVSAATDVGRVRRLNEDHTLVGDWVGCGDNANHFEKYSFDRPLFPCLIADGMGGHQAGNIASALAIDSLKGQIQESGGDLDPQHAVEQAALDIYRTSITHSGQRQMGSTIVGAFFRPDRSVTVFNVGDSRAYLVGPDGLDQLTVDDSAPDPRNGSGRFLTQALGGSASHYVPTAHVHRLPSMPIGSTLLLCSDGLYDMVPENEIASGLNAGSPDAAADLVNAAIRAGGRDNISVAVARFS